MDKQKLFIYLGILAILGANLWIANFVFNHYEAFDNSALVYGAIKYNISSCECSSGVGQIIFNQKTAVIINQKTQGINSTINYTQLENLFKK